MEYSGRVVRWRAQERQVLLWLYEHSNRSDWLLGGGPAFGNRCDGFKQVDITEMSGIVLSYCALDVPSHDGKLSLDHMLESHITLTLWLPTSHQHPTSPLPNALSEHQLSCPIWVSPLPQPSFSCSSSIPQLVFLEWKWISPARCAVGGRWWKSMPERKVFFSLPCILMWTKKGQWFSSCQFDMIHR